MSMSLNAIAGPSSPPRFKSTNLTRLDAATECPICKSAYSSPVSIGCGHSFCSRCIRDALPVHKRCPSCNEPAKEGDIRRNRALEEISDAWQAARSDIINLTSKTRPSLKRKLTSAHSDASNSIRHHTTQSNGRSNSHSPFRKARDVRDQGGEEDSPIEIGGSSDHEDEAMVVESEEEIELLEEPLGSGGSLTFRSCAGPYKSTPSDKVQCPVCTRLVPIENVNAHLDRGCKDPPSKGKEDTKKDWKKLFGGVGGGKESDDMSKLKKISKPNYNLAKEKDLRSMLDEHRLPNVGDKSALTERLQLWISLFNSNLDSSHPKPIQALRIELDKQEKARARDRKDAKAAKEQFTATGIQENAEDDDAIFRKLTADILARKKRAAEQAAKS